MSVVTITKANFSSEVLKSDKPVLMDFWAPWCGPCRMVGPVVEEIAAERNDIKVCKVNVDEQPELAGQFGVMSIPTLVVVKDGKIVRQSVGGQAQERDSWRCFEPPGRRAHGRGGMDMAQERKKRRGSRFAGGMRGLRMLREGLSRRGIGGVPRPLCQRQRRPVRGMRQVCRGMPGVGNRNAGGNGVKKKWYDALWIASLAYLALGFFNILFAWLGLLCFFIPLFIAVAKGTKGYCNRYCGRGQLLSLLGGRLGPFPQEGHSALDEEQGVSLRFSGLFLRHVLSDAVEYLSGVRGARRTWDRW